MYNLRALQKFSQLISSFNKKIVFLVGLICLFAITIFAQSQSGGEFRAILFTSKVLTSNPTSKLPDNHVALFNKSDGYHYINKAGTVTDVIDSASTKVYQNGANGQKITVQSVSATLSGLSGATATATNLIPAGSIVLGVTTRVTTLITGATSLKVGDGTDDDRWGATVGLTAGTTTTGSSFTISSVPIYTSATSVVLTANGSNFTAGAVRVTVHYISFTAATS